MVGLVVFHPWRQEASSHTETPIYCPARDQEVPEIDRPPYQEAPFPEARA
jgi:hypothetical protein